MINVSVADIGPHAELMGGLRHQHLNAHWGDLTLLACRPMVPSPQMNVGESGSVTD